MISFQAIKGQRVPYSIKDNPDMKLVREFLANRFGCPAGRFCLIGAPGILQDGRGIKDFGIQSGATVHVVFRQRGGCRE
jgi:hypothetical protein